MFARAAFFALWPEDQYGQHLLRQANFEFCYCFLVVIGTHEVTVTQLLLIVKGHKERPGMPKLEEVLQWPSVRELCQRLGVCSNTGYNWVWKRQVEAVQVLGSWRVNPRDIERIRLEREKRARGRTERNSHV